MTLLLRNVEDAYSIIFPKICQVSQAIHDGQNLEAWFTRGFYKHMLGKKAWHGRGSLKLRVDCHLPLERFEYLNGWRT